MRRQTVVVPGYDCIRTPCGKRGCGTHVGANHGIHNEEWIFAVCDGDAALTIVVGSGKYPETVPGAIHGRDKPTATDLALHTAFPVLGEEIREPGDGHACEFVEGGRCWDGGRSSFSWAEEFFKTYGAATQEQPESFWVALEGECRKRRADIGVLPKRCEACCGTGLVKP